MLPESQKRWTLEVTVPSPPGLVLYGTAASMKRRQWVITSGMNNFSMCSWRKITWYLAQTWENLPVTVNVTNSMVLVCRKTNSIDYNSTTSIFDNHKTNCIRYNKINIIFDNHKTVSIKLWYIANLEQMNEPIHKNWKKILLCQFSTALNLRPI